MQSKEEGGGDEEKTAEGLGRKEEEILMDVFWGGQYACQRVQCDTFPQNLSHKTRRKEEGLLSPFQEKNIRFLLSKTIIAKGTFDIFMV